MPGLYLEFEIKPTGSGSGHVSVVGPLITADGVQIKVASTAPGGWDSLGTGDIMSLKNHPTPGLYKFQVAWSDTSFMNHWTIKLSVRSNEIGDYDVATSGNIRVMNASIHS